MASTHFTEAPPPPHRACPAMPELPEVESARRVLEEHLRGKRISAVVAETDDKIMQGGLTGEELAKKLVGLTVENVGRKGKVLWMRLSNQCTLYLHFGMTGAIHIRGAKSVAYVNVKADEEGSWPPRFVKMQVATDCGTSMAFSDPRRLGKIWLHVSGPTPIDKLGFDPFLDPLPLDAFAAALAKSRKPIKALLLDQSFSAGVGNWVADEVLYQAGIHPESVASALESSAVERLHDKLLYVVREACAVNADSDRFPPSWLFHFRWTRKQSGQDAHGNRIVFVTVGGRTSAVVPAVQTMRGEPRRRRKGKGGDDDEGEGDGEGDEEGEGVGEEGDGEGRGANGGAKKGRGEREGKKRAGAKKAGAKSEEKEQEKRVDMDEGADEKLGVAKQRGRGKRKGEHDEVDGGGANGEKGEERGAEGVAGKGRSFRGKGGGRGAGTRGGEGSADGVAKQEVGTRTKGERGVGAEAAGGNAADGVGGGGGRGKRARKGT